MKKLFKYTGIFSFILLVSGVVYYVYPEKPLPKDKTISKLVVDKNERTLKVLDKNNQVLKTYTIVLGGNPKGDKRVQGDEKTPEGKYKIHAKNPNSDFHLNLGISYPDQQDIAKARKLGKSPGGHIKIHGLKKGMGFIGKFHRFFDWTDGCIAVTNKDIEELYHNVPIGTKINIKQ